MALRSQSLPPKRDESDRKAMDQLMEKLSNLPKTANCRSPSLGNSNNNNKSPSTKRQKARRTTTREQKPKTDNHQQTKITSWLSKEKCIEERQAATITTKTKGRGPSKRKPEPLPIASTSKRRATTGTKKLLERTKSFEKYGVVLPSYDQILADQQRFDNQRRCVQLIDDLSDDGLLAERLVCREPSPVVDALSLLDCRHLSPAQLDAAFARHADSLADVLAGRQYSVRHQCYHKRPHKAGGELPLTANSSMVVFTHEQNDRLVRLMGERFDPDDLLTDYFFKVLLPELCLLIFMDEHDMDRAEATRYLETRPLD